MINYKVASVEEIVKHFDSVSRQRIQQLLKKYEDIGNTEVVAKIIQAKARLKSTRKLAKHGYESEAFSRAGKLWECMTARVGNYSAYLDCTIEWQSMIEFRDWAVTQIGFSNESFELDKDILVKGNRVYGPHTCVFVPLEVNSMLSGCYKSKKRGPYPLGVSFNRGSGRFVAQMSNRQERGLDKYLGSFLTVEEAFACYKVAKEDRIRALANKWHDQIDPRAYEALMARTVDWDD